MAEREYPIYMHCAGCGHATRHLMQFDGAMATDLVCQTCKKSVAVAGKAMAAAEVK